MAPKGTLANPIFPAPTNARTFVILRLLGVLFSRNGAPIESGAGADGRVRDHRRRQLPVPAFGLGQLDQVDVLRQRGDRGVLDAFGLRPGDDLLLVERDDRDAERTAVTVHHGLGDPARLAQRALEQGLGVAHAIETFGRLDYAVNNAAIAGFAKVGRALGVIR